MNLSIIVPIFNEVREMPDLLSHLLHGQRQGCQVVLVDGGSNDGSVELVRQSGFQFITARRGRARQMNAGARLAAGEVLLFLHADTRLPADALTSINIAIQAESRIWGLFDVRIIGISWLFPIISWFMNLRSR